MSREVRGLCGSAGIAGILTDPEALRQDARDSYTYIFPHTEPASDVPTGYSHYSPLWIGTLLFVGSLCLIPSLVLLLHLIRLKLNHAGFHTRVQIWLNTNRWINQIWLGKLFNINTQYRYNRRLYLFSCCVSLMMISLITSVLSLLPSWIEFGAKVRWKRDWLLHIPAWGILVLTLVLLLTIFILLLSIRFQHLGQGSKPRLGIYALLFSLCMFVLACWALYGVMMDAKASLTKTEEVFFFFLRTTDLRSGVSLLLPWFCITLAALLSFFSIVRRLDLAERAFDLDLNFATPSFTSLGALEDRVKTLLTCRVYAVPGSRLGLLISMVSLVYLFRRRTPSIEGLWFDSFFIVAFLLVPLLLFWTFLRFFWLAFALRRLLKHLGWHPLFDVPIGDEAAALQILPKMSLMSSTPTYTALSSSVTLAQGFNKIAENNGITVWSAVEAERKLQQALQDEAKGKWQEALEARSTAQKAISDASVVIAAWMEPHWTALHNHSAKHQTLIIQGRLFLMSHVAAFLQYSLVQLQNLAGLVTAGLLLMLIAETSYPFQPREPLVVFGWVAILTAVAVTVFIFVQLSRDKVISLLAGTTPDHLNVTRDLVFRILIHGVLPILALLGVQFPEALQSVLSWFSFLQGTGHGS